MFANIRYWNMRKNALHLFEIDILTYLDINLTTKNYESITGIMCYFSVCEL